MCALILRRIFIRRRRISLVIYNVIKRKKAVYGQSCELRYSLFFIVMYGVVYVVNVNKIIVKALSSIVCTEILF